MPTEEEMERAFEGLSMNFNRGQYLTTIMFIKVTCVGVLVIDLYTVIHEPLLFVPNEQCYHIM